MRDSAIAARQASFTLASLSGDFKNTALKAVKTALIREKTALFAANTRDLVRAEENNLPAPLLKRLKFDDEKLKTISLGFDSLQGLPDPSGQILKSTELDEGLILKQVSCPIGVIGMIFESRPDALIQIASLCLKSGNSVLLKGGSEARETNRRLFEIIRDSSIEAGLPEGWIQLMETREDVGRLLKMDKYIDLLIPRGSNSFVQYIMDNTHIPVMGHADGICHTYIHRDADAKMAADVTFDAKTQYVAACNAVETILVHRDKAAEVLPLIKARMDEKNVKLHGCARTQAIISCDKADETNWKTEYLDYEAGIRVVDSLEEALDHINTYGSGHTDSIITADQTTAEFFMNRVDSADVFWNASTRFADGFRFGLGAEVGISTAKIHSRGPVGLEGLVIYKWKLYGNGHIVEDYSTGAKKFTHRPL